MKYLTEKEIKNYINVKDIINTIEKFYLEDGKKKSIVPERLFINND